MNLRLPPKPQAQISSNSPTPTVASAFAKAHEVQAQKAASVNTPFRYRLKANESGRVIILDTYDKIFSCYEHNYQGPEGYWNRYAVCTRDYEDCAMCRKLGKEGYYAIFFTVIDLRPYVNKDGKTVPYTKKLLCVKGTMQTHFERLFSRHNNQIRGMEIELFRTADKKDTAIGSSVDFVTMHTEQELAKYVDKDGKPLTVVNYAQAFPVPTPGQENKEPVLGSEDFTDDSNPWGE